MDWQAALRSRLTGAVAVTALVGQRIYWEERPQSSALPAVTLTDVTALRSQHLKDFNLEFARVQVDVWAATYTSKQAVMEAVIAALLPGATKNGHIFFRADIALGPRDVGEREGEATIYRKSADLMIAHKPV